jgi:hypothetical protein
VTIARIFRMLEDRAVNLSADSPAKKLESVAYQLLRGERRIGHSHIDGNPSGFFKGDKLPGGVLFHLQARFLAESNRELVFSLGEKVTAQSEFL